MTLDDFKLCSTYRTAIARIEESIKRLRSEMERATQILSQAPGRSGTSDKLAMQIQRMQELEAARAHEVADMEEHIDRCRVWLSTIPEQQARIMQLRYIDGLKWEKVADKAGYTKHHCYKIHEAAISKMILKR